MVYFQEKFNYVIWDNITWRFKTTFIIDVSNLSCDIFTFKKNLYAKLTTPWENQFSYTVCRISYQI